MADLVRELFSDAISEEAAHWMAILAMEQYAYFLADGTRSRPHHRNRRQVSGVEILLPYQALLKDDSGLEHNWDYTSDSVAVLVAAKLSADLIKATDVDGVIMNGKVFNEVSAGFAFRVLKLHRSGQP